MKPLSKTDWLAVVLQCVILVIHFTRGWGGGLLAPTAATAAVYVYEKDDGMVPAAVLAALNTVNRSGIMATTFDDDTTDGSGETPEQYKPPLAAAKQAGLPALVVMSADKVRKVVKAPTAAQVLEAVK